MGTCSTDEKCTQDAKPCKSQRGWRRVVRNFTPSWFSVNMGTGITSILLHNLPYNGQWLKYISYIIFALNVFLFVIFLFITLLRYILYPRVWTVMIRHPAQSLFIGTFPMGLATIINMIVFVCVPQWGLVWWKVAWALWWFDAAVSVACCCYLPFIIMAHHKHATVETVTAAWLLPIVSTIVAAATGGIVADVIPVDTHAEIALITVVTSYVLWATGFPLAMCVLTIYFLRLTTAHIPPREVIVSTFLPLGPLGQGGFAVQQLGKVSAKIFPHTGTFSKTSSDPGSILYLLGCLIGLITFGFGLVWLTFALSSIIKSQRFPFNMGWWGFTFPLGVYAVCTTTLGENIPSAFFNILGTIFSLCVTLLWIVVSLGTLRGAWRGNLFKAPCLKDLDDPEVQAVSDCQKRKESLSDCEKGKGSSCAGIK